MILAVLVAAVIFLTGSAHGRDCPQKYARFSTHHSYCLDPDPTCSVVNTGVDEDDITEILKVHNEFRSKVANGEESRAGGLPPAADMLELVWDPELAKTATRWAHQCKFEHDCNECRTVENFYAGQNLAEENSPVCTTDECLDSIKPDWRAMITMFYNEVKTFDKSYINPYHFKEEYGHFSQLVWAKSWRVGCGYVAFWNGDKIRSIYACDYGPGGNDPADPVYMEGETCSGCPANTKCGSDGLCKVEDESVGPVYDEKKGNLLDCNWKSGNSPCKVEVEGTNDWKVKHSISGNYKTITLNGGDKSVMKLKEPITANADTYCVVVDYRKGPTDAANKDTSTMDLLLYLPSSDWSTTIDIDYESTKFTPFAMDIGWNMETEISIEYAVPEGDPEHIFDVREIEIFDGPCSERNQ